MFKLDRDHPRITYLEVGYFLIRYTKIEPSGFTRLSYLNRKYKWLKYSELFRLGNFTLYKT